MLPCWNRSAIARSGLPLAALLIGASVTGCVYALRPSNLASQQKLRLETAAPQQYSVQVADKVEERVPPDGRIVVAVPPLERGCATYLFGLVKIKDQSPENVRAIVVKDGDRVVKKLSLNDIAKLPTDGNGYHVVRFK
jgi:hypothetical protein